MFVRMELCRIIISELGDQQIIYLRDVENPDRMFPILIGVFEATSIDRRVKGHVPMRPLTHDLLKNAIEELGGTVQDVLINNLMDHTYYAVIRVQQDGELIEIDCRPSDAIALSVHYEPFLPILVHEDVLDEAC